MKLLDVLTVMTAGGLFGNEFAIAAFVHPSLFSLGNDAHASTARRLASVLGRYMPFWYAAVLLLTGVEAWLRRDSSLVLAASIIAAAIAYTIAVLVPVNNRIAALDPAHPYDGWLADRRTWDRHHRIRVALLLLLSAVVTTSLTK